MEAVVGIHLQCYFSHRSTLNLSIIEMSNRDFPLFVDPLTLMPLIKRSDSDGLYLMVQDASDERRYPVIGDIPRLLTARENYASAFGEQWLKWRKTQLDSYSGTNISRDRLYRCLGERGIAKLSDSRQPVQVLEVGCGAGRFTEILLKFPDARVTSLDFSNAVEANQINFPQNEKHRIVQADIMQAPFQAEQFDLVICLGVVQHTPNPEATIEKLFFQVKLGGILIIDHYAPEIRRLTKLTSNLLRPIIKRLSSQRRMQAVEGLVCVFFPIHRVMRKMSFAQKIFSRFSPIVTYFHAYPQLPEALQREWAILDTHDGLTDWFKHLRTSKQIYGVLEELGATSISVSRGGNGVEANCSKAK